MLVFLSLDVLHPWLRLSSCNRKLEECNLTLLVQDDNSSEEEFLNSMTESAIGQVLQAHI